MRLINPIFAAIALAAASGCGSSTNEPADAALRALDGAYVEAWKNDDPAAQEKAVLALFDKDAVIMPGGGLRPEVGIGNLKNFWFPEGAPPTEVTHFTREIDQIETSENLAVVSGRYTLSFIYEGQSIAQAGNYLFVAGRSGDEWRIKRMIWNDQRLTDV